MTRPDRTWDPVGSAPRSDLPLGGNTVSAAVIGERVVWPPKEPRRVRRIVLNFLMGIFGQKPRATPKPAKPAKTTPPAASKKPGKQRPNNLVADLPYTRRHLNEFARSLDEDARPLQELAQQIVADYFGVIGRHHVKPGEKSWYERRQMTAFDRGETIQLPVLVVGGA